MFKIAAGTNKLTTLITFNGSNGYYPEDGVKGDGNGNLFGTMEFGGANTNGGGTIFEIKACTTSFSTRFNFDSTPGSANGAFPLGGLALDSSGNFLGTTNEGGTGNAGALFRLSPAASAPEPAAILLMGGSFGTLIAFRTGERRGRSSF